MPRPSELFCRSGRGRQGATDPGNGVTQVLDDVLRLGTEPRSTSQLVVETNPGRSVGAPNVVAGPSSSRVPKCGEAGAVR